ncbi:MAG TPA: GAF domain-containing SpoIIE family protein phosphatase [Candidatus Methylacidiphilales bacterium]|nr:GAF domain-containing SpoIIE family protein phosphatase [Candidatus Methylacidiphilales bacterium]
MSTTLELPSLPVLDPELEGTRLESLRSLALLDTPPEDRFDRITRLASNFFKVPVSYVALIDHERQWFKSAHGLCLKETSRSASFCQYTIYRDDPLVIEDTHLHPLGRDHPLVIGEPFVRFYAGVPLIGPRGQKIGSFCLVDTQPRTFTAEDIVRLTAFAAIAEREINLGQIIQSQNELLDTRQKLVEVQAELTREMGDAAKYVRLMLPPPFTGAESLDWQYHPSTHLGGDGLGYRRIDEDLLAIYILDVTGHGLGSALLAVTALELLRNRMAQVDFSRPSAVIDRLNRTFQMKDHAGKFFSAWYGVYSRSKRQITYANAGHPPTLLLTHENGKPRLVRTAPGGSVLGVLPEIQAPEITIGFPAFSELYLFTDGIYELPDSQGGHGSYDEFFAWLEKKSAEGRSPWEAMLQWHKEAAEKHLIGDDVTMLRFAAHS